MIPRAPVIAVLLAAALPAAAQQITFPCEATKVCRIVGDSIDCASEAGNWIGAYVFVWDGAAFTVTAPRGTFPGQLVTEAEAWPIVIMSFDDDNDPPAVFSLYAEGGFSAAIALAHPGMISLQGTCGPPE